MVIFPRIGRSHAGDTGECREWGVRRGGAAAETHSPARPRRGRAPAARRTYRKARLSAHAPPACYPLLTTIHNHIHSSRYELVCTIVSILKYLVL
ncbi:unnamed protein product, partial [Brenthis ino]